MNPPLSYADVSAILEQRDGVLYRTAQCGKRGTPGKVAGTPNKGTGYVQLVILRHRCLAHRVVWLLCTGAWPLTSLDHINGDRADNRFENLRLCTQGQNNQNKKPHPNKTGFPGVRAQSYGRPGWRAAIKINGKHIQLGVFKTPAEAHEAYLAGKRIHHPFFAEEERRAKQKV